MGPFFPPLVVEKSAKTHLSRETEIKDAAERLDFSWHAVLFAELIERVHQAGSFSREALLQFGTAGFEMLQDSQGRSERQRMAYERPGKEGYTRFRKRLITVAPASSVQRIHELGVSGQDADWQPTRQNLAISRQVRPDSEQSLNASWMRAKAGDDLVKNQGRARFQSDLPYFLEKFSGLEGGMAALDRFDQDGRQFMR